MPDQTPQRPTLPPNPTPDQIVAWENQMRAYNQAHPPSTYAGTLSNWWNNNIGANGSSKPSFPSNGPANPALQNVLAAKPPAAAKPPVAKPPARSLPGDIQLPPPQKTMQPNQQDSGELYGDPLNDLTPEELASLKNEIQGAQVTSGTSLDPFKNESDNLSSSSNVSNIGSLMQSAGNDGSSLYGLLSQFGGGGDGDQGPVANAGGGGLFGGMNMQDWLGLGGLGLGATGMFMNASNQKDQFNQQLALEKQQLAQQLQIAQMGNQTQRDLAAQNATQLNPYAQQQDLFKVAVKRALAANGPAQVQLGSSTPINNPQGAIADEASRFLSDSALSNAAANFEKARLTADPNVSPNDLSKTGLGKAGATANTDVNAFMTQQAAQNPANNASSQQALQSALMAGTNQAPAEKDTGGGFWKTLAKIGTIAAPIIAAPFTGGASLAAIGALSGAANSALNGGGLMQDLLGAGLGAIPGVGYSRSVPGNATSILNGLGQAGKSLVSSPAVATKSGLALMNALTKK
jgi:hypothetical protein